MKNAETPRPVVMWVMTPLMFLSTYLIFLNFSAKWSLHSAIGMSVFVLISIAMLVATLFPERGWWGVRVVAFFIFLAYLSYLMAEFVFEKNVFDLTVKRSEQSAVNALLGFLFYGVPCLNYSLWGSVWGRAGHQDTDHITFTDLVAYYLMRGAHWLFLILSILVSLITAWKAI